MIHAYGLRNYLESPQRLRNWKRCVTQTFMYDYDGGQLKIRTPEDIMSRGLQPLAVDRLANCPLYILFYFISKCLKHFKKSIKNRKKII